MQSPNVRDSRESSHKNPKPHYYLNSTGHCMKSEGLNFLQTFLTFHAEEEISSADRREALYTRNLQ